MSETNLSMSGTICGKCLHAMHWHECPLCTGICRNDVSTYDPDPRTVDESEPDDDYSRGFLEGMRVARLGRSSSKVVLLALGVGAALGFVAGWVARSL